MNKRTGESFPFMPGVPAAPEGVAGRAVRVVMLVNNPCVTDSRVIRQAESLAGAGYETIVLARRARGVPVRETRNGVEYIRLVGISENWCPLARRRARLAAYLRQRPRSLNWYGMLVLRLLDQWWRWRSGGSKAAVVPAPRGDRAASSSAAEMKASSGAEVNTGPAVLEASVADANEQQPLPEGGMLGKFARKAGRKALQPAKKSVRASRAALARVRRMAVSAVRYFVRASRAVLARVRRKAVSAVRTVGNIGRKTVNAGRKKARSAVKNLASPMVRRCKQTLAAGFVFEDVDVAMRRRLASLRPDIVHAHDLMTLPTASAVAGELGASLVYDSHELEMHRNANYAKLVWRRRGSLERRHIRRANLTITVSDSIADHLRDAYAVKRPVVIINAPMVSEARADRMSIRRALDIPAGTPLAIYVGSVTVNRGLEVCVEALKHSPALHFAAVGPRNKLIEAKLLSLALAYGVTGRFHLVDPVAPDEVVDFIRDADVSVLPIQNVCLSYYYCLPNKLFESVLSGLPVAVADLVELRRFVERFKCGVVIDETDPRSVAQAIEQIAGQRERYVLCGDTLAHVRSVYSWPAQAAALVASYRDLPISPAARS